MQQLTILVALTGVAVASVTDWTRRRVPNWLTVPMILLGLLLGLVANGWLGLCTAATGLGLGFLLFVVPFAMGWLGGGDVKLFAGLGALLGANGLLWISLYAALAGGLCALGMITYRLMKARALRQQLGMIGVGLRLWLVSGARSAPSLATPVTRTALRSKLPYAIPIAAGTVLALLTGHL